MNGVAMSRLATNAVVAAMLVFTAAAATGCVPTASVPVVQVPRTGLQRGKAASQAGPKTMGPCLSPACGQ